MSIAQIDFDPLQAGSGVQRNKQVLVVDDSRFQRRIITGSLKGLGFHVIEAASGEEAMEICRKNLPDIVLSDWVMPGMSGLEFCREFREISEDHFAYFIILTSKSEKHEIAKGLDEGADDFLTKPVNGDELRARVNAGKRTVKMQRELRSNNNLLSATLNELRHLYDSLDRDLLEAKKLQQSLLRERHKSFEEGDLSLMLRSSGHVGGDLVGHFPAGEGKLGMFAIDVSGHGISSALMTARLAGYLSATALDQNVALQRQLDGSYEARAPKDVVADLNELVLSEMQTEHYFTMILLILDLETGKVMIAQAGQPHPVIQRSDGTIEQSGTGGFPVGLMPGVEFQQFEVTLRSNDRLLVFSDGVTECPDPAGQLLDEEGVACLMGKLRERKGDAFFFGFTSELEAFAGTRDFPDDVSAILFDFKGPASLGNAP